MAWTSVFDGGACVLKVQVAGQPSPLWEGTLGKNSESDVFTWVGRSLQVSVDASGVVTLSCSEEDFATGFTLTCTPSYALNDAELQASEMSIFSGLTGQIAAAYFKLFAAITELTVAFDGSCTPDPVTSSGTTAADCIALSISAGEP